MNGYEKDILNQPADIRRALDFYKENEYAEKLAEYTSKSYKNIIFTGMGSSFISCYSAATMLRNAGFSVMKIPSSQLLHFETKAIAEDSLLACVSQSGESVEVAELIKKLHGHKNIIGITNDMESTLGKRANLALNMRVAPERSVSTRTYLASLAINHILAKAFCGGNAYDDVARAADCLEESLKDFNGVSERVDGFFGLPPYMAMMARGFSVSTAEVGALYVAEVAKYPVIPFDAGGFRHGPLELVNESFNCVVFAPEGNCHGLQIKIAEQIAANGGKVLLITDGDYDSGGGNILAVKQKYPCAELECFVNVLAAQVIANNIAKRKGLDVGQFFHSSKITSVE